LRDKGRFFGFLLKSELVVQPTHFSKETSLSNYFSSADLTVRMLFFRANIESQLFSLRIGS
jgi:hypothetical protein